MSRFLFVVPPLAGHVNPAIAVGRALLAAGHEIGWVGAEAYLRPRLGADAVIYPTGMRPYRGQLDRGMAALRSLWAQFVVPFARFTLPAVDRAVLAYRPDVVVVDQHAIAGALAACRHGLRWATLAPQTMELTEPLRALPEVRRWILGQLAKLSAEAGVSLGEGLDLRFSPHLVIALTSTALTGDRTFPEHFALVGPAVAARPGGEDFDWSALDPGRRLVLITVGTLALDVAQDFYARVLAALRPLADRVQAIVVVPAEAMAAEAMTAVPDNVILTRLVPFNELMPRLDAVLCHGGMNTVCETLAHGVPLVIAPIRHDQPVNANEVARAGAGIRVSFARARPEQLRAALTSVLDDPAYRQAAGRVRDSFIAAGGAAEAARRLAALAAAGTVAAGTVAAGSVAAGEAVVSEFVVSTMEHDRPAAGGGSPK